jgi:GH25 family lysozyme M1 (1,4-beta-N-acetylmuramidase)
MAKSRVPKQVQIKAAIKAQSTAALSNKQNPAGVKPAGGLPSYADIVSRVQKTAVTNVTRAQGLDLSKWQENFDPTKSLRPIDFVILKASEGIGYSDKNFKKFYQSSKSGGVPITGAYHYLRSGLDVTQQVNTFLNEISGTSLDFLAVDVEHENNVVDANYAQMAREFIRQVGERTGKPVLLYTSMSIADDYFNKPQDKNIPLWLSWPEERATDPIIGRPWAIWQQSYKAPAKEYGVTGATAVDYNVFAGDVDDMRRWLTNVNQYQYDYRGGTATPFVPVGLTANSDPVGDIFKTSSWGAAGSVVNTVSNVIGFDDDIVARVSNQFKSASAGAGLSSGAIPQSAAVVDPVQPFLTGGAMAGSTQTGSKQGKTTPPASSKGARDTLAPVGARGLGAAVIKGAAGGGKTAVDPRNPIEKLFNADMEDILFYSTGILLIGISLFMMTLLFTATGVKTYAELKGASI